MPVEISILEVMLLGALVACLLFVTVLLLIGMRAFRRAAGFVAGFRSFGTERVNGVVQMTGRFDDERSLPPLQVVESSSLKANLREAFNFEPSPEDLRRAERAAPEDGSN